MANLKTASPQRLIKLKGEKGQKYNVRVVALSPNCKYGVFGGKWTSSALSGWQGVLSLFDLESGELIKQFEENDEYINCVTFTPDLRYILSSSIAATRIWDINNGKEVKSSSSSKRLILNIDFSPNGQFILIDSANDEAVRLLEFKSRREVCRFAGHQKNVYCFKFSPDGKNVLSGSYDKTIRIWGL